jgi:hypothetical protein
MFSGAAGVARGGSMKIAAIFPVGTSTGGCPDAIAEILKTEPAVEVYLLYGGRAAPNASDPKDSVEQIRTSICDARVSWAECRLVDPYHFSETYAQIRTFMTGIVERKYDRVYVGITGGTNPMTASLFQIAMAYLPAEVVPMYVQARGAVWERNFVASDVRDRVTAEEALSAARGGQIRIAARLAEHLPSAGPWKFLRSSLAALSHWDDFDYHQARQTLQHQARSAGEHAQNPLLGPTADTVARLATRAGEMSVFAKQICDQQNFGTTAKEAGWPDRVSDIGTLLVADALANAQRRTSEGRFTDSVLRTYRAAECATQMRLLAMGIHPSRPDACEDAYCRYVAGTEAGRREMGFTAGLRLLESAVGFDLNSIQEPVRKLASTRNHTYLEHGYERVQEGLAQRCFEWSLAICEELLGPEIGKQWQCFQMRF